MRWASAASTLADGASAAAECAAALRAGLGEGSVDLCLAFLSTAHVTAAEAIAAVLREALAPRTLAGATARGVVTREHELEQGPALSLIAARLPGVEVKPFLLPPGLWGEPVEDEAAFDRMAPGVRGAEIVLLMGDPFTLPIDAVLALCNRFAPGVRVVGGMASAGVRPEGNALFLNDWLSPHGGFAIALHGAVRADVVVSQGCAPIGPPLDVTHVERNIIHTLDGVPALERTQQVLSELPPSEHERLGLGL
jgi:small ligand-binding sensory domain FIST